MKVETKRATANNFGRVEDLGFDKKTYVTSYYETDEIPDGEYAAMANNHLRMKVNFKPWDDPFDCKFVIVTIKHGQIGDVKEVNYDLYRAWEQYVRFENTLSSLRDRASLSQVQLSEKTGISISAIQKYETGERDLRKASVSTIQKLSHALHCTMEDLI